MTLGAQLREIGYRISNAASTAYALDMMITHVCGDTARQQASSVADGLHHTLDALAGQLLDLVEFDGLGAAGCSTGGGPEEVTPVSDTAKRCSTAARPKVQEQRKTAGAPAKKRKAVARG